MLNKIKILSLLFILQLTTYGFASVFELSTKWKDPRVDVCWLESFAKNEKEYLIQERVKKIVVTEFNLRTIFKFDGWKDCQYGDGKVPISLKSTEDIASIGLHSFIDHTGYKAYVHLNLDNFSYISVLHEFGHLAGLRHENERKEAVNDYRCSRYKVKTQNQNVSKTAFLLGPYDPNSIMNYCYNRYLKDYKVTPRLSKGDVSTLNFVYESL